MGDAWITDMRHFLDVLEPDVEFPRPARRLAEYFGKIVEAATSNPPMVLLNTEIRCRRRPGRKPCVGHVRLVYKDDEDEGEIIWECTSCGDRGIIRGFEGTPWDRSLEGQWSDADCWDREPSTFEPVDAQEHLGVSRSGGTIAVVLDDAEFSVVRTVSSDREIPMKILDNAARVQGGFRITATARNVEAFHDYLLEIAMSHENPSYVQLMGQSIKKMAGALDDYLDEIF